ncbi:MAG: DUF805 domain-containing protein [Muribaculaceae bacterium]
MYQRQVSFGEAISRAFNNYANFNGRASRSEYWWFALFNFILGCIPFVNILAGLALLIPSLALGARRLHDTGRSGWWLLLALIPFGAIVLLVFFCQDSQPMPNEYGPVPNTDDNNGGGWNNGGYNNGGYNNGGYNNGGNYGGGYNNGGNYGGGNNGWGNNNNGAIRQ